MPSRGYFCISCGHHFVLVSGAVGSGFCHFSFSLILGCGVRDFLSPFYLLLMFVRRVGYCGGKQIVLQLGVRFWEAV